MFNRRNRKTTHSKLFSVEDKKPPPPDPNFQPYPQVEMILNYKILFEKKQFNSNQLFLDSLNIEDPCNSDFMTKPHQIVLKNFMHKEHLIIVYWYIMV